MVLNPKFSHFDVSEREQREKRNSQPKDVMVTHYQLRPGLFFSFFFFDLFDSCGFENEDINCQYSLNAIDRPCVQISSLDSSRVLKYLRKSPGLEICPSRLLWGLLSR